MSGALARIDVTACMDLAGAAFVPNPAVIEGIAPQAIELLHLPALRDLGDRRAPRSARAFSFSIVLSRADIFWPVEKISSI
jgi:hypothetical protein